MFSSFIFTVVTGVVVVVAKSCLALVTPWSVAHQDPLSMGFSDFPVIIDRSIVSMDVSIVA